MFSLFMPYLSRNISCSAFLLALILSVPFLGSQEASAFQLRQVNESKPLVAVRYSKNGRRYFLKFQNQNTTLIYRLRRSKVTVLLPSEGDYTAAVVRRRHGLEEVVSKTKSITIQLVEPDSEIEPQFGPAPSPGPAPEALYPDLPEALSFCDSSEIDLIENDINALRTSLGLPALERSELLVGSAQEHAITMAMNQKMSHDGWFDSLQYYLQGTKINSGGQVVAYYIRVDLLVQAWSESPGHLMTLSNQKANHMAAACVRDENGVNWYAVNLAGLI